MPIITGIELQKNRRIVNLFVDGKFISGIGLITLVKLKLKVGTQITQAKLFTLLKRSVYEKLLNNSYRFLSYRPRSEKEVRTYLIKKTRSENPELTPGKIVNKVIDKLKRENLVNEEEFVKWWLGQRQTFRPKGKFFLAQELRAKGIAQDAIEAALENQDDLSTARQLANRKLTGLNLASPKDKKKLIGFLSRRGFSWETIKRLVDEMTAKK